MMVDFQWSRRKLDTSEILALAACNYIAEKHNIILLGASGAGKTWLLISINRFFYINRHQKGRFFACPTLFSCYPFCYSL
jgi:DNA replication protein DnaC